MKGECLAIQPVPRHRLHGLGHRPVAVAARTHHVETLQRKARRIHLDVAGRATWMVAVPGELLADGHRAADIRFDGFHIWRWRASLDAEYPFGDPVAAQHRRGGG